MMTKILLQRVQEIKVIIKGNLPTTQRTISRTIIMSDRKIRWMQNQKQRQTQV